MSQQCPQCEGIYGDSIDYCPRDETKLQPFDAEDDPLIGHILDERFRLNELLGAGGMGRVYRGQQLSVERDVAVKILRKEAVSKHSMEERFFREARIISEFNHPNIIRLIDFGHDPEDNIPYLVMELAGGVSLANLLESARLEVPFAVEVCRQVCSGLVEAHGSNIIHRDLKPENLHLITLSDGAFHVKILDFGIAFPQETNENLTKTGMMCGTPTYTAPEQAHGEEVDGQADLYALGIILFQCLTGHLPFSGDSGFEIIMKQVKEPPPPIEHFLSPGELPDALVNLLYELLEKNPRDRPEGPESVRDRLDMIADELDTSSIAVDQTRGDREMFEPWLRPEATERTPDPSSLVQAETAPQEAADASSAEMRQKSNVGPKRSEPSEASSANRPTGGTGESGDSSARRHEANDDVPVRSKGEPEGRPEDAADPEESVDSRLQRSLVAAAAIGLCILLGIVGPVVALGAYWGYIAGDQEKQGAPRGVSEHERVESRSSESGTGSAASTTSSSQSDSATASPSDPDSTGAYGSPSNTATDSTEETSGDENSIPPKYRKKMEALKEECRKAQNILRENIQKKNERMRSLARQGKYDKLRELQQGQNQEYSQKIREVSRKFSALTREMMTKGIIGTREVRKYGMEFSRACQGF